MAWTLVVILVVACILESRERRRLERLLKQRDRYIELHEIRYNELVAANEVLRRRSLS